MNFVTCCFNEPHTAIIVASTRRRVLTVENIVLPKPNLVPIIAGAIAAFRKPIYTSNYEPLVLYLTNRCNIVDIHKADNLEIARESYSLLTEQKRFVELVPVDISTPFIWDSLCVLLCATFEHLSSVHLSASGAGVGLSATEAAINLINNYEEEADDGAFYVDRNRYRMPGW